MFADRVGDDGAVDRLSVELDALHTLLATVGMDGYLVLGLAELTADGVI